MRVNEQSKDKSKSESEQKKEARERSEKEPEGSESQQGEHKQREIWQNTKTRMLMMFKSYCLLHASKVVSIPVV
jgi:hypothetical protein